MARRPIAERIACGEPTMELCSVSVEIPEKLSAEEWQKLPDHLKPIFHRSDEQGMYEYSGVVLANSMKSAKEERDKLRAEKERLENQYKAYSQFGDPEAIADLMSREQLIRDGTKHLEDGIKKAKAEADERYGGMLRDLKKENERLLNERLNDHKNAVIDGLLANSGVDPEYMDEVRLSIGRRIKTELRDGRIVSVVVSEENPNEIAKDPDTFDPLTPERYFQMYRTKKSKFFRGETEGSGAGFAPNGRGTGPRNFDDKDPKQWSFAEKREFMNRYGGAGTPQAQQAYQKLLNSWAAKRQKSA